MGFVIHALNIQASLGAKVCLYHIQKQVLLRRPRLVVRFVVLPKLRMNRLHIFGGF